MAVLHHPAEVRQTADQIESMGTERLEEWEVLTAVAASLRECRLGEDRRQPEAEIHLLRHLAARSSY